MARARAGDSRERRARLAEPQRALRQYATKAVRHGNVADMVVEAVRQAVYDGVFQPAARLREQDIAEALSVSRTPVREALRRLAVEGLVTITPHQGAVVTPLSTDDIMEVYVVRERLEGLAARLAARSATDADIDAMRDALGLMADSVERGALDELPERNLRFHAALRLAAHNRVLENFLDAIERSVRRFGRTTFSLPDRPEESLVEHERIIEAVEAGDEDEAERSAIAHMHRARELRIQLLTERWRR